MSTVSKTDMPLVRRCLVLLLAILSSCQSTSAPEFQSEPYHFVYQVPEVTGDGWEAASLLDVGLMEGPLSELMMDLHELENHDIHALVAVRDEKLVFEEYFYGRKFSLARYTGGVGFDRNDTHNLASVTKSITTTLLGIALDQGFFGSVHDRVFDSFPEHVDLVVADPRRGERTIEDLLLMTSGITFKPEDIPYSKTNNDLVRMFNSEVATERIKTPTGPHAWADGYGWWHWDLFSGGRNHAVYMASGWGGQWIFVIPEQDMVFVSTAGNYSTPAPLFADRLLSDYLLPAIQ